MILVFRRTFGSILPNFAPVLTNSDLFRPILPGVVQQRALLRRVLRRVLETAFEKVLGRVLRMCPAVGFRGKKGSEKGS